MSFLSIPFAGSAIVDKRAYIRFLSRLCWTYILIQDPLCADALAFWISKATTLPLTIQLRIPDPFVDFDSILSILGGAMHQCVSFNFCIHPSMQDALRNFLRTIPPTRARFLSLTFSQPSQKRTSTDFIALETALPALTFLRLFQATIHWIQTLDFSALTHLIFVNCAPEHSPSWNDFGVISICAPNLTHASFRLISCRELPFPHKAKVFPAWRHLQHFDLELADNITIIILLTRMRFPALRVFHLRLHTHYDFDDLLLCAPALSSVQELHITLLNPPSVGWVAALLRTMPRISSVVIVQGYGQVFNALMDDASGALPCPALSFVSTVAPACKVRLFAETRLLMSDSLQSVGIRCSETEWDDADEDLQWLCSRISVVRLDRYIGPGWIWRLY
ncbi:hypothetical protein B0H16DRAFT_1732721 [Mycena metata]|uniref:Uncharacterized protein n=1 Tax=Mycena metata TaxID=1033252 RepID=A0AAD7MUC0_9AGAR|nr:hypothetical protein B0H16DRAFT_1732721 [Mycena metata]